MAPPRTRPSVVDDLEPIGDSGGGQGAVVMSRFERSKYFERLVELHLLYAMRGDEDRTSVMTIDEVIAWVESEFEVPAVPDRRSEPAA
jgi:hypothetical protein